MRPFPITVAQELSVLVIPDTLAHADGHAVITYSYSIYEQGEAFTQADLNDMVSQLHLKHNDNPNYMGVILFEQPGKLFTYEPGLHKTLDSEEVQEIIEKITEYRENPALWNI